MSSVDYYDVQNMIRDSLHGKADASDLAALRDELRRELEELRDEIRSIDRVLQSRTEHLA